MIVNEISLGIENRIPENIQITAGAGFFILDIREFVFSLPNLIYDLVLFFAALFLMVYRHALINPRLKRGEQRKMKRTKRS